jgi:hypothetical protein
MGRRGRYAERQQKTTRSDMDMVRQCELRAPDGGRIVTWIAAEHAEAGKRLTLKLDDGTQTPIMEVVTS